MTPLEKAIARINERTDGDDWVLAATVRGLLIGYDSRWRDEQRHIHLRSVEQCYTAPLINIETGRKSRTFSLVGLLDKTADDGDEEEVFDHKTTSSEISDPSDFYWRQLTVDSQPSLYELLAMCNGRRVSRVTWDVTKKPAIRPKEITKKIHAETYATGHYYGFVLSHQTLEYLVNSNRENGELFTARVAADCMEDPDKFFARRSVPRTREQLAEYARELWEIAGQIQVARRTGKHPRNSGACFNYNRPCPFLSLCSGSDTPDSDRWRPKTRGEGAVGGDNILSNSRMRTFQACQRKHYYSYELKIERDRDDRDEALYFGSLWGEAMDVWWSSFNEERLNGNSSEQPGSDTGSRRAEAGLVG
jgi:hypothetical protein